MVIIQTGKEYKPIFTSYSLVHPTDGLTSGPTRYLLQWSSGLLSPKQNATQESLRQLFERENKTRYRGPVTLLSIWVGHL